MPRSLCSLAIGLGIPAVAIVIVPPLISNVQVSVLGIPLLFFWMFAWFPLTTICLAVSWYGFDRRHYTGQEGSRP